MNFPQYISHRGRATAPSDYERLVAMSLAVGEDGALRPYVTAEHRGVVDAIGHALAAEHELRPALAKLLVDFYRAARRRQATEALRRKPQPGHALMLRRVTARGGVSMWLDIDLPLERALYKAPTAGAA